MTTRRTKGENGAHVVESDFYECPVCRYATFSLQATGAMKGVDVRCPKLCGFKGRLKRLSAYEVQQRLNRLEVREADDDDEESGV